MWPRIGAQVFMLATTILAAGLSQAQCRLRSDEKRHKSRDMLVFTLPNEAREGQLRARGSSVHGQEKAEEASGAPWRLAKERHANERHELPGLALGLNNRIKRGVRLVGEGPKSDPPRGTD